MSQALSFFVIATSSSLQPTVHAHVLLCGPQSYPGAPPHASLHPWHQGGGGRRSKGVDVNDRLDEMSEMSSMGTQRDLSQELRGLQKGPGFSIKGI